MKERIAIIQAIRTPFCKAYGLLNEWDADDLGAFAVRELMARAPLRPEEVSEVIIGNVVNPSHAMNVGRVIAIKGGIPENVPASTVSRNCSSGMEAIVLGVKSLLEGDSEVVLAGGSESMSNYPILFKKKAREWFLKMMKTKSLKDRLLLLLKWRPSFFLPDIPQIADPLCGLTMGQTAEVLAREFHINREEQDRFALMSHERAGRAIQRGFFKEEIVPIPTRKGMQDQDEGPRLQQTIEELRKLKPSFEKLNGTVTAGSSSQITDGACMLLLCRESTAKKRGWTPLGYINDYAYTAHEPRRMGLGPAYAIHKLLKKTGLSLSAIDLFEINEAFAVQVLAVRKALASASFAKEKLGQDGAVGEIPLEKLNVNGGAIALGHPLGASGARITFTLLHELKKRGLKKGIASLCVGGGQGEALLVEVHS